MKDIKIEEVNFLAWRLVQMDEHYGLMYEACLKTKETGLTIKDMINLTYTLDNCHVGYGIDNNEELGRFAADGDFIEELVNVPDEVWNYIDFEKVGKRMMESEKGIFINGCYVACDISDMQEIYDGITLPPCPTDTIGIFNLLIAKAPEGDESTESQGRWLYLPASNEQLSQLLQELDVQSYDECVCYRLSTTIPKVSDLFTGLNQLDILNTLAKCIRNQEQIICKAVLEFVECDTLEQAIEYCENLSCFDYYPNMIHPKDFGKYHCDLIATVSPDSEIYSHIDFESYGREQMACLHVKPTAYGFMSRNDQEPVFRHSKIMEQAITHLEM